MTPNHVTLGEAVAAYLATLKVKSTRETYEKALYPMRDQFGPDRLLTDLTTREVADWFNQRWGSWSDGTITIRMRAIRAASKWWVQEKEWTDTDLSARLKYPSKPRGVRGSQPLTPDEVQRLLKAIYPKSAAGIRNRALIMLLYTSGLRISEALAIAPSQLNFGKHEILLKPSQTKTGKQQVRGWNHYADDALRRWMDKRRALGIRGGTLFCGYHGNKISAHSFRHTLDTLAVKAGIDKRVHPHGLRDTFAIKLQAEGKPLDEISALLGHTGPNALVTTTIYLRKLTGGEAVAGLQDVNFPDVDAEPEPEPCSASTKAQLADLQAQIARLTERLGK